MSDHYRDVHFDKLTGSGNYHEWAVAAYNAMVLKDLDNAITVNADGAVVEKDAVKLKKSLAYLTSILHSSLYSSVDKLTSAHEVWLHLKNNFDDKGLSRQVSLYKKLNEVKIEKCDSPELYVLECRNNFSLVESVGLQLTDEWKAIIMLQGLTKDYEPMVLGIQASGLKLTSNLVASKLIDCSIGRGGNSEQGAAFNAFQKNSSNRNNQQPQKTPGGPSKSSKGPKKNKKKKSGQARTAEETGYESAWSATCRQHDETRAEDEADVFEVISTTEISKFAFSSHLSSSCTVSGPVDHPDDSNGSVSVLKSDTIQNKNAFVYENGIATRSTSHYVTDSSANVATEVLPETAFRSTLLQSEIIWTIDSGASSHMVQHNHLTNVTLEAPAGQISTANGENLKIEKKGSMEFILGNRKILLNNVCYVPDLQGNLLSVSRIASAGKKVVFEGNKCLITSADGAVLAEATAENGIYKLKSGRTETCNLAHGTQTALLWHRRLAHMNPQTMLKMSKKFDLKLTSKDVEALKICTVCAKGKQAKLPFPASQSKTTEVLALIHSDVQGPMKVASLGGAKYILVFVDDYSRKFFIYLISKKDQVFEKFKLFKAFVENQTGKSIRVLRSDNGGEYFSKIFDDFLAEAGILHQSSNARNPQQNGLSERANRTLIEKAKCLISEAALPDCFWGEAVNAAAYIINRSINATTGEIPEELFRGERIKIENLRTFGCRVMVLNDTKSHKFEDRSREMTFVGYDTQKKGYRCFDHVARKIIVSRDVKFHESMKIQKEKQNVVTWTNRDENDDPKVLPAVKNVKAVEPSPVDNSVDLPENDVTEGRQTSDSTRKKFQGRLEVTQAQIPLPAVPTPSTTRSGTTFGFGFANLAVLNDVEFVFKCDEKRLLEDPVSHAEIKGRPDEKLWLQAMDDEMHSLHENRTWILVDLPDGKKTVKCRWIFKTKISAAGKLEKYKARLVARGFTQRYGEDFTETFSPVVRYSSVRILFAVAAIMKMKVHQMDVKTAFLHGDIEETIYMQQPPCYEDGTKKVCLLKKSLYGLRQASRNWNLTLQKTLKEFGLIQSYVDQCIYFNEKRSVIIAIYVDDLLLLVQAPHELADLKNRLNRAFRMTDLGLAKSCIGIRIHQTESGIQLDQSVYIEEVLKRFNMTECNPATTPAATAPLTANDENDEAIPYQQAVGALLFIAQATRPDIAHAVNVASRFNQNHTQVEWQFVKRIMRYLKFTQNKRLSFVHSSNRNLIAYSDSDYASDKDDRKSTTGYIVLMAGAAINWRSTKQKIITLSSTEAEFMALTSTMQEVIYFKQLLSELNFPCPNFEIKVDNTSAIKIAKSNIFSDRTKHIDVRYKFIAENSFNHNIKIEYVNTNENIADYLTKPLSREKFEKFTNMSGLI